MTTTAPQRLPTITRLASLGNVSRSRKGRRPFPRFTPKPATAAALRCSRANEGLRRTLCSRHLARRTSCRVTLASVGSTHWNQHLQEEIITYTRINCCGSSAYCKTLDLVLPRPNHLLDRPTSTESQVSVCGIVHEVYFIRNTR